MIVFPWLYPEDPLVCYTCGFDYINFLMPPSFSINLNVLGQSSDPFHLFVAQGGCPCRRASYVFRGRCPRCCCSRGNAGIWSKARCTSSCKKVLNFDNGSICGLHNRFVAANMLVTLHFEFNFLYLNMKLK